MAMPFALFNDSHQRFRTAVRAFVEQELRPHSDAWERKGSFPRRVLEGFGRRGFLTLDPWQNAVVAEELPRCESLGLALSVFVQANLVGPLLAGLGTKKQQKALLAPLLKGKMTGAVAVSEPGAGSDLAGLECTAEESGGEFLVDGTKTYITNGGSADFLIVAARTARRRTLDALSLILIPVGTPGVRVERLATLGLNTSSPAKIVFQKVRVSKHNLLGELGAGFGYVQQALNRERLFGGLACVAWAEHAMDKTAAFARSRHAFGKPLTRFQSIRHQFAEMATALEAARQLNYAAFARWVDGKDATKEISMVKLHSYQATQQVIERCLQLHGGAGYLDDHWASRFYQDARALTIAAGTPEIMKELIAACMRL
jgi:citronellyl-CoA dehydrogenase